MSSPGFEEGGHGGDLRSRPGQPDQRGPASPPAPDIGEIYVTYRPLLFAIALRKFNVPEADCESLVHDTMLALLTAGQSVANPRAFLIGAICNASRAHLRARTRVDTVEGARLDAVAEAVVASEADRIERELLVRRVLQRLHPAEREVLRLHYYEHLTAREIAARLHVTHRYAEKRIVEALRHARVVYGELLMPASRVEQK